MEIEILASSSAGNCYIIGDCNSRLMIDPGLSINSIKKKGGFKVHEIQGCLVSHEH